MANPFRTNSAAVLPTLTPVQQVIAAKNGLASVTADGTTPQQQVPILTSSGSFNYPLFGVPGTAGSASGAGTSGAGTTAANTNTGAGTGESGASSTGTGGAGAAGTGLDTGGTDATGSDGGTGNTPNLSGSGTYGVGLGLGGTATDGVVPGLASGLPNNGVNANNPGPTDAGGSGIAPAKSTGLAGVGALAGLAIPGVGGLISVGQGLNQGARAIQAQDMVAQLTGKAPSLMSQVGAFGAGALGRGDPMQAAGEQMKAQGMGPDDVQTAYDNYAATGNVNTPSQSSSPSVAQGAGGTGANATDAETAAEDAADATDTGSGDMSFGPAGGAPAGNTSDQDRNQAQAGDISNMAGGGGSGSASQGHSGGGGGGHGGSASGGVAGTSDLNPGDFTGPSATASTSQDIGTTNSSASSNPAAASSTDNTNGVGTAVDNDQGTSGTSTPNTDAAPDISAPNTGSVDVPVGNPGQNPGVSSDLMSDVGTAGPQYADNTTTATDATTVPGFSQMPDWSPSSSAPANTSDPFSGGAADFGTPGGGGDPFNADSTGDVNSSDMSGADGGGGGSGGDYGGGDFSGAGGDFGNESGGDFGGGYAMGGVVQAADLRGPPHGFDPGYAPMTPGEFVVRANMVTPADLPILRAINAGDFNPGVPMSASIGPNATGYTDPWSTPGAAPDEKAGSSATPQLPPGGQDDPSGQGQPSDADDPSPLSPPSQANAITPDDAMMNLAQLPPDQKAQLSTALADPQLQGALLTVLGSSFAPVIVAIAGSGPGAGMGAPGMPPGPAGGMGGPGMPPQGLAGVMA